MEPKGRRGHSGGPFFVLIRPHWAARRDIYCVGGGRMEKTEPTVRLVFAPEDGPSLRELLLELLRAMREEPER